MNVYVNPRRRLEYSVLSRISAFIALFIDFSTFCLERINYLAAKIYVARRNFRKLKLIFACSYAYEQSSWKFSEVGIENYWKLFFGDKNNSIFPKIASRWSNRHVLLPWWWKFNFLSLSATFDLLTLRYFWSFLRVPLIMPARYSPPLLFIKFSCTALEKYYFLESEPKMLPGRCLERN